MNEREDDLVSEVQEAAFEIQDASGSDVSIPDEGTDPILNVPGQHLIDLAADYKKQGLNSSEAAAVAGVEWHIMFEAYRNAPNPSPKLNPVISSEATSLMSEDKPNWREQARIRTDQAQAIQQAVSLYHSDRQIAQSVELTPNQVARIRHQFNIPSAKYTNRHHQEQIIYEFYDNFSASEGRPPSLAEVVKQSGSQITSREGVRKILKRRRNNPNTT